MSFETITIERRQPIFDKKFIKIPSAEDGQQPPITIDEAEVGIDTPTDGDDGRINVMSFGRGRRYNTVIPHYSETSWNDFVTYDAIGLDGYRIESGDIDDVQESIREIAKTKPGSDSIV